MSADVYLRVAEPPPRDAPPLGAEPPPPRDTEPPPRDAPPLGAELPLPRDTEPPPRDAPPLLGATVPVLLPPLLV